MLDLTGESEQREFNNNGPVPGGSTVLVQIEVLQPHENRRAKDNAFISVAQTGLRQIYCQLTVAAGTYQGVSFRQNICLPFAAQTVGLTYNQKTACNIGGATLKAICLAAKRPPKMKDVTSLTGLRFPVCVKINPKPTEKDDGRVFWNNEIAHVVTPEKEVYAQVFSGGEVITDGPVAGNWQERRNVNSTAAAESEDNRLPWDYDQGPAFPSEPSGMDESPF